MSIHIEKNIFIIPYWILNIVERNHLPLSAVLDLDKLTDITSAEDIALTSMLNEHNERIFGVGAYSPSLYANWYKNTESWSRFNNQIKPLEQIVHSDLETRLFNPSSLEDKYDKPFEIKDIESNTFLAIIYPGYFGGPQANIHQQNITKEVLKLFYVYEGYDDMAKRQIFESYLNSL